MPSTRHTRWTEYSDDSSDSGYSESSSHSQSTAPTDYSRRPSLKYHTSQSEQYAKRAWDQGSYDVYDEPRSSAETYASTVPSVDDLDDDLPPFEVPSSFDDPLPSTAIASTPQEFAEHFPSGRKLLIRHDDSTLDGNMNLRVDTEVREPGSRPLDLTLFHLRMHDLKNREFSLRRYCRDSGREVCHSSRKYTKPAAISRPNLQRSMSSALSSLRSKTESRNATKSSLKRQDSGYDSVSDEDIREEAVKQSPKGRSLPLPTNTTQLEFSNYAHLDVKRRGANSSKRYEFDYWGINYTWKRVAVRVGHFKEVSYHLINNHTADTVAHIVPATMTPAELQEEEDKGGWVPPCLMWISDQGVVNGLTDVADVIVATGLTALVDDSIKSKFHQKNGVRLSVPALMKTPLKMNMEYVGPKQLLDEVFHRRSTTATRRPTPLRQISARI
ncbi:MAG: hypothetical protein L6R42_007025 [Xanthoria sp. 1 TBL-2021]|nr:MAG: hypothetical protein L6R42_007025 [Xanthoria sp. 1 TBL-2021]